MTSKFVLFFDTRETIPQVSNGSSARILQRPEGFVIEWITIQEPREPQIAVTVPPG
jgi:hypothetical protein